MHCAQWPSYPRSLQHTSTLTCPRQVYCVSIRRPRWKTQTGYYVRARVDRTIAEKTSAVLSPLSLSLAEAIRLMMQSIADEGRLPFDAKQPNTATKRATAELEVDKGRIFDSV